MADGGADEGGPSFAARLRHLIDTHVKPGTGEPYSPDDVAKGTGLSTSYVNYLLSGERDNPSRSAIQQLANFFRVQPNYFFDPVVESEPGELDDADLATITVLARGLPPGVPRASLRKIVEQVAALEARNKSARRGRPTR
ncbi:helix-turn-helix domain-containing protein [Verrucosispora sp. WMMA2044]|uniref:Helix-turn-helix transcriptional regulator n=1 Tax=Verrucosispora sioxanthis TaxID=2499994 RepID=A0A6M1LCB3_9ACTN|nr:MULTISPECIES: helix-turn-helix domain-containing protein [Micromonospora]NEE66701.1 helix-turn-helix transcriptional regulator [Verrucosispora sioxanthis]NGM15811.1 helix-turn-helix transcriptional regulator [Verrucosispora sioxanthis]WBB48569.1 helix-turn-helix domain-containing protein [Verrucosispora sp. WMMA2044]